MSGPRQAFVHEAELVLAVESERARLRTVFIATGEDEDEESLAERLAL